MVVRQDWIVKLLELQEKDLRIIKLQRQVDEVPRRKAAAEEGLRQKAAAVEQTRQKVLQVEKGVKALEMEADALRAKQHDFQSKSTMIRDNDEYRAALHQIEECRGKISRCEDRELELMEELEESRRELAVEKKKLAAEEERTRQSIADLELRQSNCREQIAKLQGERNELAKSVAEDKLQRYERILRSPVGQSGRPPLAPVGTENICGGCHMNVPAQDRINAVNGLLVTCPNCGVMLYHEQSVQ